MWSQFVLALLVAFAYASENPGWNEQSHYVYHVHGRSLASLNQISDVYSGIVFHAQLEVQPKSNGNLAAKISNSQYTKVHAELKDGWETELPESEANYQPLKLSEKPFEIVLEDGVVRNVIVSSQIKNWEANMIKSIVSQLQLDTKAKNRIESSINIFTQEDSNTAVFKTMEETVTGVSETLYEIHAYPEYVLQSKPWVVPLKSLNEQGEVIEIVKNKNFTHSPQAPSYHFGLQGIEGYQPGNKVGDFLTRSSVSQAVITGSLEDFTVQSSVTYEEISLSPTLSDKQRGSVHSKLNLTLAHVSQKQEESKYQVENGVEVGVVYAYDHPYSTDNGPRKAKEYDHGVAPDSSESSSRSPRSLRYRFGEEEWQQEKPRLGEAPPSPLLPFTVGYDGQSIKKQQNIVETVRRLAQEIGQESTHAKQVLEQQTAGKFVTLTSLVRILDENEVQQVAQQLYSQDAPAWFVYRDAVAQAGTGPAIQNMKKWIQGKQISNLEAAQIIATAANAARQPTQEYMQLFNDMIQDEEFMSKPYLNESALLSYTTLVRQVYGNEQESYGKFPVYSYGTFRTTRGQELVKKTIIPYLTTQLNNAINNADTRKVHVYIRALGNVGQQHILEAFEPYLEGQRKSSHFQRVLMVLAMDQLVKSNPRVARSVLYKIYQNSGEYEQVRVAAVYQLMRTAPSAAMLQRMASYTNVDKSHYVNAAVKSAIRSAAKLEAPEHDILRDAAQSAEPLLTNEEYGAQYSQGYLLSYAEEESQLEFHQHVHTFNGKDHAVPQGIKYMVERKLGGLRQQLIHAQAIVSSMEDLINVFQQQTKEYQREQQEKQTQGSNPWSSENLAKVLNLQNEQREQLEGNIYSQLGPFQSILSFDNQTLELLAQEMQELEQELSKGKRSEYNKMIIGQEAALALPTVLGLPFIYTYDRPILMRFQYNLKVNAEPQISSGDVLQKPDTVKAEFDISAVLTSRSQSQFGIFTPFDHQRYSAGYHKNLQFVLPLSGKVDLNLRKHQLSVEILNPGNQENVRLAHYSSWPYTAQNDIYSPKPTLKIIHSQTPYQRNIVVGEKATGVGMFLQIKSDRRIDPTFIYERLTQHCPVDAILKPWVDENIQFVQVEAGIDGSKSSTQQILFRLGYQSEYVENDSQEKKPDPNTKVSDIPTFAEDPEKRQMEFVDKLGEYINDAEVVVADATVEFNGQNKIKYSLTAGSAKSNVDPHGRFMALIRKVDKQFPTALYVQAVSQVPNTNGLDLEFAMKMNPTSKYYVQALLRHSQRLSRTDANIELSKSQERVQYLQQQQDYKKCKEQMRRGNHQLPTCAEVTANANLLDQFEIQMDYNDMDPQIINATYKAYSLLRHGLYPRVQENIVEVQPDNKLNIRGQYSPSLEHLNITVQSQYGRAELKNAPLRPWARALLVPHPVFHTAARLQGQILKEDTYRPICVVDQTATSTFDNKTYPSSLFNQWTVVLQYVPRRPSPVHSKPDQSVQEQLHQTVESYVVYARAEQQGSPNKEVQVFVQMPKTQGKVVKIVLQAASSRQPKVLVNDQIVKYTSESSSDFYNGNIQIYALPNQEVKVEIRQAFYLIFNGKTLKVTAVNSKFRDSARGLCGTFTGEPETDFATPDDCIIYSPEKFIQSYTVGADSRPVRYNADNKKCFQKKVTFANYISNQDAGRSTDYEKRGGDDCTGHLTRYEENDGEICFSIRPLPFCKDSCSALHMNTKSIDVHCLSPSATTAFWRAQIDKKINVDFTMMQATRKLPMQLPARCLP